MKGKIAKRFLFWNEEKVFSSLLQSAATGTSLWLVESRMLYVNPSE